MRSFMINVYTFVKKSIQITYYNYVIEEQNDVKLFFNSFTSFCYSFT